MALNSAFTEEGAVIQVGPRTVLDKPVYVLFLSRAAVEGQPVTMSHPRLLVQLGSRAEASVIEHHIGETGATNFTNMVSEVMLERGAVLNHYKLGKPPPARRISPRCRSSSRAIASIAPST